MTFAIRIMPRGPVLDPQGRTIQMTLKNLGYESQDCKVGKWIEVQFSNTIGKEKAFSEVQKMAAELLHNPLIEDFEIIPLEK